MTGGSGIANDGAKNALTGGLKAAVGCATTLGSINTNKTATSNLVRYIRMIASADYAEVIFVKSLNA